MRTIDIVPTALSIMGKSSLEGSDGKNVRKQQPSRGVTIMEGSEKEQFTYKYEIKWKYEKGKLTPKSKLKLTLQNLNALLLSEFSSLSNDQIAEGLKYSYSKIYGLSKKIF